jgi:hypothetical protein
MWRDLVLLAAAAVVPIVVLMLGVFRVAALKWPVDLGLRSSERLGIFIGTTDFQSEASSHPDRPPALLLLAGRLTSDRLHRLFQLSPS